MGGGGGTLLVNRDAALKLMTMELSGDWNIQIDSTYFKTDYSQVVGKVGILPVKYMKNTWLTSMNMPNEQIPNNQYSHQRWNGFIWGNTKTSVYENLDTFPVKKITMWGQVYPVYNKDEYFTEGSGTVTICLSKSSFKWFDEVNQVWKQALEPELPRIYGLYNKEYRNNGDFPYMSVPEENITVFEDHIEIVVDKYDISNRVLHFGVTSTDLPLDKWLHLAGDISCWIKEEEMSGLFVSNLGFDIYVDRTNDTSLKEVSEYGGSRYYTVTTERNDTRFMYVEDNYYMAFCPTIDYNELYPIKKAEFSTKALNDSVNISSIIEQGLQYDKDHSAMLFNLKPDSFANDAFVLNEWLSFHLYAKQDEAETGIWLGKRNFISSGADVCGFHIRSYILKENGTISYFEAIICTSVTDQKQTTPNFFSLILNDQRKCDEQFILKSSSKDIFDLYFNCKSWFMPIIYILPFGSSQELFAGFKPNKDVMKCFNVRGKVSSYMWLKDELYTGTDVENGSVYIV